MSAPYITYDILINAPTGITWANYVQKLEDQLWNAADGFHTNSELSSNEY